MEHCKQMESLDPRKHRRCVGESQIPGSSCPVQKRFRAGVTPRAAAVTTRLQVLKPRMESVMEPGCRPG